MNCSVYRNGWVAAICLAVLSASAAEAAGAVPLDTRYVDAIHGFSLRPPSGGRRTRDLAGDPLVAWAYADPDGAWVLSVATALEANPPSDLEAYSQALAAKLREGSYDVESVDLASVAGKAAMHFRGQTPGVLTWQRQCWVQSQPGVFLIIQVQGAKEQSDRLDALADAVLVSLEVTDPTAAIEQRKANLQRGQNLLTSLDAEKLVRALHPRPQWFLLRMNGQDVGFRRVVESQARREKADGVLVKTIVFLELPGDEPRLLRQELFVTPDFQVERWLKRLQVGSDETASVVDESGLKQGDLIVCNVLDNDRLQTFKKTIPGPFYLPQAVGTLLPKLVDLRRPAAYAFAAYNAERNDFDMRTVTVSGFERVEILGRQVEAHRMTDRAADNAEPAELYLDDRGELLRMTTQDGLIMEQAGEQAVMRRFPKAEQIVRAIDE